MPFLDGVATSVHGIVLPDGVAVLRPVELVTLRQGHDLRYAGARRSGIHRRRSARRCAPPRERSASGCATRSTTAAPSRSTAWRRPMASARPSSTRASAPGSPSSPVGSTGLPLPLVLDLVVAGPTSGSPPPTWRPSDPRRGRRSPQRRHVAAARPHARRADGSGRLLLDGEWRWATSGRAGRRPRRRQGRLRPRPVRRRRARPSARASAGARVSFWRFADAELGTAIGPLEAPPDIASSSTRP